MSEMEPLNDSATTEAAPVYRKVPHDDGWATQLWFIVCDEGWRETIVCERMYEWAADDLLGVLNRRPDSEWKGIAAQLAAALRQCQVPDDWPMAWPDGTTEGAPWITEALALYDEAVERNA
jgi:hypothetical protein